MKKFNVLIALFLTVLLTGCSSSSSSDSGSTTDQNVTFKFNGENVTAAVTSAKLYKVPATGEKMLEIIAESDDKEFEFKFYAGDTNVDAVPIGDYISSDTSNEGYAYVSFKIDGNKYGLHSPENGVLHISNCNASTKIATGTFTQTLYAIGETQDFDYLGVTIPYEINITNGIFTNIQYEVVLLN